MMNKRARQYVGLLSAVMTYYVIHEGAHLVYALITGTFKGIRFMGLGMQIDVYAERMTETELGIFCLSGAVATLVLAYVFVALAGEICALSSKAIKACAYYITIAMLLLDPLYLSVLCGFFGGGDMNGISLLLPEWLARTLYGVVLVMNAIVFVKLVFPKYKAAFQNATNHSIEKDDSK